MLNRIVSVLRRRVRVAKALVSARRDSWRRIQRKPVRRVVVVCYGNIYRSPFVAQSLRRQLGESIEVRSGGFHPVCGRDSPQRHIEMCKRYGIDLSQHRSAVVSSTDLEWADTIIFMDRHNWAALDERDADHAKLVWLGAFGEQGLEVADPYNLDGGRAEQIVRCMDVACKELVARIRAMHPCEK